MNLAEFKLHTQTEIAKLATYKHNAHLLYAMGLRYQTLNYSELFTEGITDGGNDKKIDFLRLDPDSGEVVIAQGYCSNNWEKKEAPANKASDLNTAFSWLYSADLTDIPDKTLRAKAQEFREALNDKRITSIHFYYVHNLPSSVNVKKELDTLAQHVGEVVSANGHTCRVFAKEIGIAECLDWYNALHTSMRVLDQVEFSLDNPPLSEVSRNWSAYVCTLKAVELTQLASLYLDDLTSANVRDFLGSRESARNINHQIQKTAEENSDNFWVFNNGITILTRAAQLDDPVHPTKVRLDGISVINGAQTTGTLRELPDKACLSQVRILARIVVCSDPELVNSIIRYNNTQNPIKAWELRVIDPIQTRLVQDFATLGVTYQTRRSKSRWSSDDIPYDKLGQYLISFFGSPDTAHRHKPELFSDEQWYRKMFAPDCNARNLLFIYRVGAACEALKEDLKKKLEEASASPDQVRAFDYFRYSSFIYVLTYLTQLCLSLLVDKHYSAYTIALKDSSLLDAKKANLLLGPLLKVILNSVNQAVRASNQDAYQVLRSREEIEKLGDHVRTMINNLLEVQPDAFDGLKAEIIKV